MSRTVVVGDLMVDVVASALEPIAYGSDAAASVSFSGGGSAANAAAWLAALGVPVALVTRVGDDVAGRGAVAELEAAGVEVRAGVDPSLPTGTCVVVVTPGGERTMLPDRGANDALTPADLGDVAHVHLSGYTLLHVGSRAAGLAALASARTAGATISVDPSSAAPLRACPEFLSFVVGVDVLLPNRDELAVLTGTTDVEAGARALAAHVGEVVVTLGADGALWTDGTSVLREPAASVAVVDSTGAGDAFAAGWIAARTRGPEAALRSACAAGARAVAGAGARPVT